MRYALRIAALIVVTVLLHLVIRSQVSGEPSANDEAAYRDWMLKKADDQTREWEEYHGIADLGSRRDYDLEPYADPTLYAPGSTVILPGDVYRGEAVVTLPGGSENNGSSALGDYARDPRVRVVRNGWQDWGVEITIDDVWVENYVYSTWRVRQKSNEYALKVWQPPHGVAMVGSFSRDEIARLQTDGARFNAESFDPSFDQSRGEGCGWRARVRYRIAMPLEAPILAEDRSIWGEVVIAAGVGGEPYKLHLIHLEDREGAALRPFRQ
jgi:hypothetical protein